MISSHMTTTTGRPKDQCDSPSTSYVTGTCFSVSIDPMLSSPHYWILDSGASKHVCFHARAFSFLKPIKGARVTLPDRTSIHVSYSGDIQLNPNLTLTDVLYVSNSSLISYLLVLSQRHLISQSNSFMITVFFRKPRV